MYKQVRKQRALVTRVRILMKNSNNIKWGVSTADTLLLRALQTDRVTRHTHYAATIQPLSVMMMAALNRGTAFKPPPLHALSCSGGEGGSVKARRISDLLAAEFRHAISLDLNVKSHLDYLHLLL